MNKWLSLILLAFSPQLTFAQEKLKVVIIDTGLNLKDIRFKSSLCKDGHKDFTEHGFKDEAGHGTAVAGLIQKYANNENYCIVIIKYFYPGMDNITSSNLMLEALNYAVKIKADIVNISSAGRGRDVFESNLFKKHKEILFVVAAGNNHCDLDTPKCNVYPAKYRYNNMITVGNEDSEHSNWGKYVVWEKGTDILVATPNGNDYMTGTSMAAAVKTGKIIHEILQ